MSTTAVETLESLQDALDPLSALRGDQAELGSWIHDSFSALEKLHAELTQWQSELARKETELDLRQDALSKAPATDKGSNKPTSQLEQELARAKNDLQQLGKKTADLKGTLAAERARAAADREVWKEQFESLRGDLANYYQLLAEQVELLAEQNSHTPLSAGAALAKSVELRRRAQSRREAKGRNR